jgi:hypothetical protein
MGTAANTDPLQNMPASLESRECKIFSKPFVGKNYYRFHPHVHLKSGYSGTEEALDDIGGQTFSDGGFYSNITDAVPSATELHASSRAANVDAFGFYQSAG